MNNGWILGAGVPGLRIKIFGVGVMNSAEMRSDMSGYEVKPLSCSKV